MMNKFCTLLLGSILVIGFSIPCFADQVQGVIESIDSSDNSIVIKDPVSGAGKTVHVHPKVISEVKKGSVAKATLKSNSDKADTIEVLTTR